MPVRRGGVHFASAATGGIDETRDGGTMEGGQSRAPPRWTTSAFTDDLCATLQMGGGSFDKELPVVQKLLEKILQTPDLPGGNRCRQGLAKAVQAIRRSCEDVFLRWALYKEWSIQFHLSRICEEIHSMINRSVVGDFFIFPVGACQSMGIDERLMVVHRTASGNFTVSVIAVATSLNNYHAWSATADVTKLKMKTDFTVEEVPKKRIDSEAFWACVLMCSERRYLYEIYLPWLTDQCYDEIHLVDSTQTGDMDRRDEVRAIVEKAIADRKEADKARGIEEKKVARRPGQEEEEIAPDNITGETGELPQLPDVTFAVDTTCTKEEGREQDLKRKATAKAAGFASGSISASNIWKVIIHALKHILRLCEVEEDAVTGIRLLIKKALMDGCREDLESGYYALDGTGQLIVQTAIQNASGALTRNGYLLPQDTFQAMTKSIIRADVKLQQLCAVGGGTDEGGNGPTTTFIASDDPSEAAATRNANDAEGDNNKASGVVSKYDVRVDKMTYPSFPPHGEKSSVGTGITKPPPLINVVDDWDKLRRPERFPMAECLMRIEDTNAMAGAPDDAVRQTPINFIKTLPKVKNIDDALTVLDQSIKICLDYNNDQATRSQGRHCFQILAVLHDLFTNVLPVPLGPISRAKKPGFCIYDTTVRYGQQLHFMSKLHEAQQMFIWASFTLRAPKEHDAVRIIVSGAMATIGDAVMRLKAVDHPSVISLHLNSARKRPGFGIGTGRFASQTETSVMYNASLVTTRAGIQDYHDEILEEVPASNVMWKWENGTQFCKATSTFLRQICLSEGFRVDALPRLFLMAQGASDSEAVLGKYWTEFRYHRDLYLTFKMTMAPGHDLPACPDNYLVARPAVATWQASFDRFMFEVAFMNLNPLRTKAGGLRFPSYAVPSKFTAPLDPQTEDDILHIKNLPTFNDNLGQRDSELLLSYLTAPYIRIPLVLNFFATEERIGCLNNPQVTQLLESVLFEPGRFLTAINHNICPQQVPSENPDLIATPFGYLFNELLNSPHGVVDPILKLVSTARETDAGTVYNQNVFQIVLFLIRVASRVDSFLSHVISFTNPAGKYYARGKLLRGFEQLHNTTDSGATLKILLEAKAKLQVLIKNEMIPMLDAWSNEIVVSIEDQTQSIEMAVSVAAKVHAHQIMLLRNFAPEDYTKDTVSVMVSSMVFLNTRYAVGGGDNEGLLVDEREIADVIQVHRRDVIRFLLSSPPSVLAYVMDSTVRVATTSGQRKRGQTYKWGLVAGDSCLGRFSRVDISSDTGGGQRKKKENDDNDGDESAVVVADKKKKGKPTSVKRHALLRDAKLCLDMDESAFPSCFDCVDEGKQDVEVNLHMFSLTFKASHLTPIDPNIISSPHFSGLFLPLMKHNYGLMSSIQCATVQNSKHRLWVRLVGLDYDVQLWKSPDKRIPLPDNGQRFYPDDLSAGVEDWIPKLLEPVRKRFFVRNAWQPPILIMLPEFKLTAQQNVIIASAVCSEQGRKLAEIVLYRDFESAHVYNIVNIGRRFYRTLCWASNSYYSPTYLQPAIQDRVSLWTQYFRHEGGGYNEQAAINATGQGSVVIIRHSTNAKNLSGSMETYLHRSLLFGIIPQSLLDSHEFWQDEDDNIRGYPYATKAFWYYQEDTRYISEEDIEIPRHLLWIRWKDVNYDLMSPLSATKNTCVEIFKFADASKAPKASEKANLKSQKFTQHDNVGDLLNDMQVVGGEDEDEEDDSMQRQHTFDLGEPTKETSSLEDCNMKLINLMNAPAGTPLFTIAQVFSRLEPLSHIQCWTTNITYDTTKPENTDPLTIDLIYLPFLKLSFSAKVDSNGVLRIFSLDHAHLFVSNIRTPRITELLQGIPQSLVLADIHGSVAILVPALNTKQPRVSMAPFSTELVVDRTDINFYEMADARYYLFPVHVSFSFLFAPTLASSLYLLAMRFLHREYEDAFRIASTIGTDMDLSTEESRNFGFLEMNSHRPDALATLTKVTLLLIDSPFEQYVWYIPELLGMYIARRRYVSLKCRLTPQEEIRLLHIANKMRIRVDAALAKYRQQLSSGNQNADIGPVRDAARLHYFRDVETSVNITSYIRCLLHNRRVIMAAEDDSINKFESKRVTNILLMWPPTPTTSRHTYFRDYTPTKVKVPAARRKLKNSEPHGSDVNYSETANYFYCGKEVRKNGQCKCGNCDTFCGSESGCPCRECEQFNKKIGSTMLYLPEELNVEDIRFISFFGVSDWMASLVSGAMERERVEVSRGKRLEPFMDPQRANLRDYFSRFYGIITDAVRVRIGGMDSGKDLIQLLFPLMRDCCDESSGIGHLMHYLLNNPQCWKKLPKLINTDRDGGGMYGKKDINKVYGAIIQQATLGTRYPRDEPVIPAKCCVTLVSIEPRPATREDPFLPLTDTRLLPTLSNTDCDDRKWSRFDIQQLLISEEDKVDLTDATISELRGHLLHGIVPDTLVQLLTRAERGLAPISEEMPFDLGQHEDSNTTVAQLMISRLEDDMKHFSGKENNDKMPKLTGFVQDSDIRDMVCHRHDELRKHIELLKALDLKLRLLRKEDNTFADSAFNVSLRTVNSVGALDGDLDELTAGEAVVKLRRIGRQEVEMDVLYLISCLACSTSEIDWQQLNPFLTTERCTAIQNLIIMGILRANRVGHINRTSDSVKELIALLQRALDTVEATPLPADATGRANFMHMLTHRERNAIEILVASISQKADGVAGLLSTKRCYIKEDYSFDPRFIIFEFTWNLILRGRQREMIMQMLGCARDSRSMVQQMIMGAGKTTVVGPLLALMLANKKNLVIQVVPPALLDFTRSILRGTFSCIIQKQIFCFVCDRNTEIDDEVLHKFIHAKNSRGIVVTTPSSIKSVFLKFMEGLDKIEDVGRKIDEQALLKSNSALLSVLKLWQEDAVLIMDEVDILLHPLRSELNFPIGPKLEIDFAPIRWKLPIHLLDALFYFHTKRCSVISKDSPGATAILNKIRASVVLGLQNNALQATPHLTLLNREFYHNEIRPHIANWVLLFLKANHCIGLNEQDTLTYILHRPSNVIDPALNAAVMKLESYHIKTLNLAFEWLNSFLPHCMQKIDRVSFGIMNAADVARADREHPQMPRSRKLTAIPFVGKDLPSDSSEFAHPDVVIGLTILAFRYEGLRRFDFNSIMSSMHGMVEKEAGRFHLRPTNMLYQRWVDAGGGKIVASFNYANKNEHDEAVSNELGATTDSMSRQESTALSHRQGSTSFSHSRSKLNADEEMGMQPSESLANIGGDDDDEDVVEMVREASHFSDDAGKKKSKKNAHDKELLPLKLMKQAHEEEWVKLFKLFRRTPEVIHWYLCEHIFPEYMRHQHIKLSASGQEIGGNILFEKRLGFSGTPSDLLPTELGKCAYEHGTDGQLIRTLTAPNIMSYEVAPSDWTVRSVLDNIANAFPPYHGLIDTGALITGMSNLQVAQYLLKRGLQGIEGCVFLDEYDRKMILVRATGRVITLAECGIPKLKRFAFYDQVHTTGMDIDHTPNAMAVQTVGKDMVFRDFAQGAYRMRGIGKGQTVHIFVIPEVYDLIETTCASLHHERQDSTASVGMGSTQNSVGSDPSAVKKRGFHSRQHKLDTKRIILSNVTAWLLVNSIRSEHVQHNQLCIQNISNVYRKEGFACLRTAFESGKFVRPAAVRNTNEIAAPMLDANSKIALEIYREPQDFEVPADVPQPIMFSETLTRMIDGKDIFITDAEGCAVVEGILTRIKAQDEVDNPVIDVQMVQEQEEEKEAVHEIEKKQEVELEKFVDLSYSRADEAPTPWSLSSLTDMSRAQGQFYALSSFHLYKRKPIAFPSDLMFSRNFFNPKWTGHRRLKNVIVTMEWIPQVAALKKLGFPRVDFHSLDKAEITQYVSKSIVILEEMMRITSESPEDKNHMTMLAAKFVMELALGHSVTDSEWVATLDRAGLITGSNSTPFADVDSLIKVLCSNYLREEEDSRYTVALSLCEAETLRRVIHIARQQGMTGIPHASGNVALQLNVVPSNNKPLDATPNFVEPTTDFQRLRNYQCLRFVDGDLNYSDVELNYLLRSIFTNGSRPRQEFFLQLLSCRRRARQRWDKAPLALALSLANPFVLLHQRILGKVLCAGLEQRGLHLADAFMAINSSHSGGISPAELWGAIKWVGIESATASDVLDLLEVADTLHEGSIQYTDFLAMLTGQREIEDNSQEANRKVPEIPIFGAAEITAEKKARIDTKQNDESNVNKEMESEEARLRQEIERETILEELQVLQTCKNPLLDTASNSMSFTFQNRLAPSLSQYFSTIDNGYGDVDGVLTDSLGVKHWDFQRNSQMLINLRSLQFLTESNLKSDDSAVKAITAVDATSTADGDPFKQLAKLADPELENYMMTFEFRIPAVPRTLQNKKNKKGVLDASEDHDGDALLELARFNTNYFRVCERRKWDVTRRADGDEDEYNEDDDENEDYYYYEEDMDDEASDYEYLREDERFQSMHAMQFVYSAPSVEAKNRMFRFGQYQEYWIKENIGHRSTSTVGKYTIDWMAISEPVEGFVVVRSDKYTRLKRNINTFMVKPDGNLLVKSSLTVAFDLVDDIKSMHDRTQFPPIREFSATAVRNKEQVADHAIAGAFDYKLFSDRAQNDDDDDDDDDESYYGSEDEESDYDDEDEDDDDDDEEGGKKGGDMDMDILDLMEAVQQAKALKVGDIVERHPEHWNEQRDGNGDGHGKGRVVNVSDKGKKITVMWQNTQRKAQYEALPNGQHRVIKVGHESTTDRSTSRQTFNKSEFEEKLTKNPPACSNCGSGVTAADGWYQCNSCPQTLCFNCFADMIHTYHDFTNMGTLAEDARLRSVVLGTALRNTKWKDAPREDSYGIVVDCSNASRVTVMIPGDGEHLGNLMWNRADIVICDPESEQYATNYLGLVINAGGIPKNPARYPPKQGFLATVMRQCFAPPEINNKFPTGGTVILTRAGEKAQLVEIRACLPGGRYTVVVKSSTTNEEMKADEVELSALPFNVGDTVRFCDKNAIPDRDNIPPVCEGSVKSINPHKKTAKIFLTRGFRTDCFEAAWNEVSTLASGKWYLLTPDATILETDGSVVAPTVIKDKDGKTISNAMPAVFGSQDAIVLPRSAQSALDKRFMAGLENADIHVPRLCKPAADESAATAADSKADEGTYRANFENMTLTIAPLSAVDLFNIRDDEERKKEYEATLTVVHGKLYRDPPLPFMKQTEGISIDDGKWHVYSILINPKSTKEETTTTAAGDKKQDKKVTIKKKRAPKKRVARKSRRYNDDDDNSYEDSSCSEDDDDYDEDDYSDSAEEDEEEEYEEDSNYEVENVDQEALVFCDGRRVEIDTEGDAFDENYSDEEDEEDSDEDSSNSSDSDSCDEEDDEEDDSEEYPEVRDDDEDEHMSTDMDEEDSSRSSEDRPAYKSKPTPAKKAAKPAKKEVEKEEKSSSASSASAEEGEEKKDEEEKEHREIKTLKRLRITPAKLLSMDVRNQVSVFYFNNNKVDELVAKFGPEFPHRYLSDLTVHWGNTATQATAKDLFEKRDKVFVWDCERCGASGNSRLLDCCKVCGVDWRDDGSADKTGKSEKVRVALPTSREAKDLKGKLNARLKAQYQKQLDELDDFI